MRNTGNEWSSSKAVLISLQNPREVCEGPEVAYALINVNISWALVL